MKITVLDKVDSTNNYIKAFLHEEELFTVIALEQTQGRGRLGRSFISAKNGLYMSVLIKPQKDKILEITPMAAVAVAETVEHFTKKQAQIKWVNDVYLDGKKVCGILCEAVGDTVILGIGVNVQKPENDFDESIRHVAGYLFENDEGIFEDFYKYLLERIAFYRQNDFFDGYLSRSFLIGEDVTYIRDGVTLTARVKGIDRSYSLIVEDSEGEKRLFSGEVNTVRKL